NFSVLRRSSTSGNGRNGVSDSMPHCAPTRGTADCSPRGGTTAAHTPDNDMDHPVRDLVVVGASAGGLAALRAVVAQLPAGFPATMAVVLHTGPHATHLPELLMAIGPNPAAVASHGELVRPGRLVTAPPDHHLMISDGVFQTTRSAKEHHTRPAIDPLFRSAALWAGPRVIGVLLSGRNDDGTAG